MDFGGNEGDIYSNRMDGINVTYGDKIRIGAYYGKPATIDWRSGAGARLDTGRWTTPARKMWGINLAGEIAKSLTLGVRYDRFDEMVGVRAGNSVFTNQDNGIFSVGLDYKAKDWSAGAVYAHSDYDNARNKNGFHIGVNYKGAKATQVGSWGVGAKYYHWGDGVTISHGFNASTPTGGLGGFKGYKLAAYYTVAKGMVGGIEWYDLKARDNNRKAKTFWAQLNVTF
jgi:hypothetical protein